MEGRWNPWRALRAMGWVRLQWAHVEPGGGLVECGPAGTTIVLDPRLPRVERRCVLGHEVIHVERGLPHPATPPELVAKEEAAVDRTLALRLVPLDELDAFVAARAELEGVTVATVATEFDVTAEVAARALRLLVLRRQAPNHPAWRGRSDG